jgi:hypothetical protein
VRKGCRQGVSATWLRLDKAVSTVILSAMPRPRNEREAWEHELREELPAQLAAYQQELSAGLADKTRRDWLDWQIRRVRKRAVQLETWLAQVQEGSSCE